MTKTVVRIVQEDITKRPVDAIVNAANPTLLGGGGVDGAIHRAAGPELVEECRSLGGALTGQSKATKAYNIRQSKYIIHTVGPIFGRDTEQESKLLASCYLGSLQLAVELECKSIVFPSISTGAYGYPIVAASRIALRAIQTYLDQNPDSLEIIEIATFSATDQRIYERAAREAFDGASSVKLELSRKILL